MDVSFVDGYFNILRLNATTVFEQLNATSRFDRGCIYNVNLHRLCGETERTNIFTDPFAPVVYFSNDKILDKKIYQIPG